ncbi:MAG: hypothetical protein FWG66_08560 [Spirochaetes bacterium]|nr:hypothetical protein [Spirochaetota bacterium]
MKEEGKGDLRVQRTHDAICKTFTEMLLKMDYEKITIKSLAKLANINRKTFYLHYNSLDDLLEELLQKMADEFARRNAPNGKLDLEGLIKDFFLFATDDNALMQHIICDEGCHYICAKLIRKIKNQEAINERIEESQYRQNIIDAFFSAAILEILRQWVADQKRIPQDDITVFATQLLCHGIHGVKAPRST